MNRTTFERNQAVFGGGIGGGIVGGIEDPAAPPSLPKMPSFLPANGGFGPTAFTLTNCRFNDNMAYTVGGGIGVMGPPELVSVASIDTTYENNQANQAGGAGAFYGTSVTITGAPLHGKGKAGQSRLLGNVVLDPDGVGGGFAFNLSQAYVSNTLFKGNADGAGPTGPSASWFSTDPVDLSGDGNVVPPGTTPP